MLKPKKQTRRGCSKTNKPSQRKNNPQPVAFSPGAGHGVIDDHNQQTVTQPQVQADMSIVIS